MFLVSLPSSFFRPPVLLRPLFSPSSAPLPPLPSPPYYVIMAQMEPGRRQIAIPERKRLWKNLIPIYAFSLLPTHPSLFPCSCSLLLLFLSLLPALVLLACSSLLPRKWHSDGDKWRCLRGRVDRGLENERGEEPISHFWRLFFCVSITDLLTTSSLIAVQFSSRENHLSLSLFLISWNKMQLPFLSLR